MLGMTTIWQDLRYSAILGLAMLLGWGLRAAIYQISPLDPVTLGAASAILAISSLAASIIPARRAAGVLPMTALRTN